MIDALILIPYLSDCGVGWQIKIDSAPLLLDDRRCDRFYIGARIAAANQSLFVLRLGIR